MTANLVYAGSNPASYSKQRKIIYDSSCKIFRLLEKQCIYIGKLTWVILESSSSYHYLKTKLNEGSYER